MTREDAIELLENLKVCKQAHTLFNIEKEAVDVAIKALCDNKPSRTWIAKNEYRRGWHDAMRYIFGEDKEAKIILVKKGDSE